MVGAVRVDRTQHHNVAVHDKVETGSSLRVNPPCQHESLCLTSREGGTLKLEMGWLESRSKQTQLDAQ